MCKNPSVFLETGAPSSLKTDWMPFKISYEICARNTIFVCRVDSAFICLGTTRAKAGAEGFVKVTLVCIFLTDFFFIQRMNFDYSIFIVCFCITSGLQLCGGGRGAHEDEWDHQ